MTTFNLTCQAVEATLPDYLDETLEPWLRASIDDHLAGCARCSSLLRELRNIAHEASTMPLVVPEAEEEAVWSGIASRIGVPDVVEALPEIASGAAPQEPLPSERIAASPANEKGPVAVGGMTESDPTPLEREVSLPLAELFAESAPAPVAPSELPPSEGPLFQLLPPESEPRITASESFAEFGDGGVELTDSPSPVKREMRLPTSEVDRQAALHASAVENEVRIPASELESEMPFPRNEPDSEVAVPGINKPVPLGAPAAVAQAVPVAAPTAAPLPQREQNWKPLWVGFAAAALVLVTAGSTFILTLHWLGTSSAPQEATAARSTKVGSALKTPATARGRTRASGSEVAARDQASNPDETSTQRAAIATAPTAPLTTPGELPPVQTVSLTSAPPAPRSPEDAVYDNAIVGLQKIVRRKKRELDAPTMADIEENLRSLDSANGEIKAALRQDPHNSILDDQSSHVLEMKVELLRRAAMLHATT